MKVDFEGILRSERLAITRALSFVENTNVLDMGLTDKLFPHLGLAYRIGVTGPPGAGKSSLVDQIIKFWRDQDKRVAVILVDPTSPFTGGAILGDRVRMGQHYSDKGVFIRSMATRGSRGGLALSAQDSADIFDAAVFDVIIYETVGVGQVELDVASAADTTMVVLVPESGDDIQAMKAGLMEIADLFVINKADRPSANQALTQIQSMLEMRTHDRDEWLPPVLKTSALNGEGMPDLTAAIVDHQTYLQTHGKIKQNLKERTRKKIQQYIDANVLGEFWTDEKRQVLDSALSNDDLMGQQPSQIVTKLLS